MDIRELLMPESTPPRAKMSVEDAKAALRLAWRRWQDKQSFTAGDIIQQKEGMEPSCRAGERGEEPAIFLEYREDLTALYEKPSFGLQYTVVGLDCLVGWLGVDGGMVVSPCCSQLYELVG